MCSARHSHPTHTSDAQARGALWRSRRALWRSRRRGHGNGEAGGGGKRGRREPPRLVAWPYPWAGARSPPLDAAARGSWPLRTPVRALAGLQTRPCGSLWSMYKGGLPAPQGCPRLASIKPPASATTHSRCLPSRLPSPTVRRSPSPLLSAPYSPTLRPADQAQAPAPLRLYPRSTWHSSGTRTGAMASRSWCCY